MEIPVVIELQQDALRGVKEGRKTIDKLVEQGLRARLDLASLITGQLFVELSMCRARRTGVSPTRPIITRSHRCPPCKRASSRR